MNLTKPGSLVARLAFCWFVRQGAGCLFSKKTAKGCQRVRKPRTLDRNKTKPVARGRQYVNRIPIMPPFRVSHDCKINRLFAWPLADRRRDPMLIYTLTVTAVPPGRRFYRHHPVKPLAAGRRAGENAPLEKFRGGEPVSRRTATVSG